MSDSWWKCIGRQRFWCLNKSGNFQIPKRKTRLKMAHFCRNFAKIFAKNGCFSCGGPGYFHPSSCLETHHPCWLNRHQVVCPHKLRDDVGVAQTKRRRSNPEHLGCAVKWLSHWVSSIGFLSSLTTYLGHIGLLQ